MDYTQLTTKSGKVYNLAPLTLGDLIAFKSYVQFAAWHRLYAIRDQFPVDHIDRYLDDTFEKCASTKVFESEIDTAFQSADGKLHLMWLAAKHNHDEVTKEELAEHLDFQSSSKVFWQLLIISHIIDDTKTSKKNEAQSRSTKAKSTGGRPKTSAGHPNNATD